MDLARAPRRTARYSGTKGSGYENDPTSEAKSPGYEVGDARPQNNLLISNFTIFESLLFEGYSCKRLQTLLTY